ncbi:p-aminobenzoyl-glutamate hydrolase subunit B [Klebsiella electrica]|nr:p-aminobenzoyl-glutamate hydrolase subunit B [Klebsiella electrica]
MEALYRYVDEAITARAGELTAIADAIWDHPETRFEEFW